SGEGMEANCWYSNNSVSYMAGRYEDRLPLVRRLCMMCKKQRTCRTLRDWRNLAEAFARLWQADFQRSPFPMHRDVSWGFPQVRNGRSPSPRTEPDLTGLPQAPGACSRQAACTTMAMGDPVSSAPDQSVNPDPTPSSSESSRPDAVSQWQKPDVVQAWWQRLLLRLLAGVSLCLAVVGAVLPGLPTTVFVLIAAWAAARSSPALHAWLVQHKVFGPVLLNWNNGRCVSRRAKRTAAAVMSLSAAWMI